MPAEAGTPGRRAGFLFLLVLLCGGAAPATKEASFDVIYTRAMAPCTMHVNALDIKLLNSTPLTARYEWDFGDTSPESKYNTLAGWNAAHVFTAPGKYTITLNLTEESGERRSFTRTIQIEPDTRRPIYLSAVGNDSANGSSPATAIKTLARAAKLMGQDTKILLRRGDVYDLNERIEIKRHNILISAWDDSTSATTQPYDNRPVIRFAGPLKYVPMFDVSSGGSDFTMQDLTFDSTYSRTTEKTGMPDVVKPASLNMTVRNCVFLNIGYGVNGNSLPRGVMVQDNTCPLLTGLRSYFVWAQGSDYVILGNTVANSTREHCIRVGGADRLLIAYNTLSNRDRRPDDAIDTSKGAMTIHTGNYVYVSNNTVLHGELALGPLGEGDGLKNPAARWNWGVIENNRVNTMVIIRHGTAHVMCRDNIIYRNDWAAFAVDGFNEQYQRGSSDITIMNNTGINRGDRGNFLRVTGPVDGITVQNNLYIAPNLKPADNSSGTIWVDDKNLDSFRTVGHNIWPDVHGFAGNCFVRGMGGYLPQAAWLNQPFVKDDSFQAIPLPDRSTEPAAINDVGARR